MKSHGIMKWKMQAYGSILGLALSHCYQESSFDRLQVNLDAQRFRLSRPAKDTVQSKSLSFPRELVL